jgi:hypothetical protein
LMKSLKIRATFLYYCPVALDVLRVRVPPSYLAE